MQIERAERFEELPNMSVKDLESELNFYQFLINNEPQLGGVEMKHRVWLEAIKIEVKRRGLLMENRIKLIEGE